MPPRPAGHPPGDAGICALAIGCGATLIDDFGLSAVGGRPTSVTPRAATSCTAVARAIANGFDRCPGVINP
jgi:hypothetical protein